MFLATVQRRCIRSPSRIATFITFHKSLYRHRNLANMAATKRKRPSIDSAKTPITGNGPALGRRSSARNRFNAANPNPNLDGDILDAPNATRASPDSDVNESIVPGTVKLEDDAILESPLSDALDIVPPPKKQARGKKVVTGKYAANGGHETNGVTPIKTTRGKQMIKTEEAGQAVATKPQVTPASEKQDDMDDPEADGNEVANEEDITEAISRPPPVHSDYLPLPWKGRLGYACLNTYLRQSNPPVFSSRTCRIQSILEHRHPLKDPTQPEHATKNRPDKDQPADIELGRRYVQAICLANVRDISKMIRWNHKYNIKFLRLSSEMFPFASHPEYGYKLEPFAAEALAEAGKVIAELGHRVTTHPGQFTQLGSPRKPVIDNSFRDLDYHAEMLSLLKLPEQANRDAVMILHMGGIFEGKQETLQRFRENYPKLSQNVKNRLVLENDDMGWSVHDLLPICEELNIPMVLDYHHHNIVFDKSQIREGTKDIIDIYPRIKATWDRKKITQKMHYSEPTAPAITPTQRRKHSPRVATLPPCAPDMDLMIEAKDKEQAVFELMRTFKLPGYDSFNDIIPYVRNDDNKIALALANRKKTSVDEPQPTLIPDCEVGMGGPEGRVYWPPGMEEWLRPKKREAKPKVEKSKPSAKKTVAVNYESNDLGSDGSDLNATPATKKAKAAMRKKLASVEAIVPAKSTFKGGAKATKGKKIVKGVNKDDESEEIASTPSESDEGDEYNDDEAILPVEKRTSMRGKK